MARLFIGIIEDNKGNVLHEHFAENTEVQQIRESFNNKVTTKELAKQYNISVRQVYNIVTKQNWKNVTI